MKAISLREKLNSFSETWHPHRIARVDDMHILLAKVKGEFLWHTHEEEDEMFQVLRGTLYMQFRDRTVTLEEGEIIVVPKGVEHCPATRNGEEVHLLLFEKETTAHTGKVQDRRTRTEYPQI